MTTPPDPAGPTAREIAELTARLRTLTRRDPGADPARDADEQAAFLADKDALLARIIATEHAEAETSRAHTVGYAEETITRREAAERLTEHGHDPAAAQAIVADYLDDTLREIRVPVHQWGLDQHDVDAIAARHRPTGQLAAVPAHRSDGEQERREQLTRWHADDRALDSGSVDAAAAVRQR
jgi:hypothetical protein